VGFFEFSNFDWDSQKRLSPDQSLDSLKKLHGGASIDAISVLRCAGDDDMK
jgi:hypothetical protein